MAAAEQLALDEVNTKRCGSRFSSWDGGPVRCDLPARHGGNWHKAQPGRDALIRWNDDGSFDATYPTVRRSP